MAEEKTNPVKRLQAILKKAQKQSGDLKFKQVIEISLSSDLLTNAGLDYLFDEKSSAKKFHLLEIGFINLVESIEEIIKNSSDYDEEIYLKEFHFMWKLIDQFNYDLLWKNLSANLTPQLFTTLVFCNEAVSKIYYEKEIDQNELLNFLDEINKLIKGVMSSNMDKDLKELILDLLKIIYDSILKYHIYGSKGLLESIDEVTLKIKRNKDKLTQNKANEYVKSSYKYIYDFGMFVIKYTPHIKILLGLASGLEPDIKALMNGVKSIEPPK